MRRLGLWMILLAAVGAVAAESGETLFREGRRAYLARDYDRAVALYRRAAALQYAPALNSLGCCSLAGRGMPKSPSAACQYFQKSADLGDAKGKNNVGFCYMYGAGYLNYPWSAINYCRDAADSGLPVAQYNYADMLRVGLGTAPNPALALTYYRKSAAAGFHPAAEELKLWNPEEKK